VGGLENRVMHTRVISRPSLRPHASGERHQGGKLARVYGNREAVSSRDVPWIGTPHAQLVSIKAPCVNLYKVSIRLQRSREGGATAKSAVEHYSSPGRLTPPHSRHE
jgi:hypothetical protein